MKKSKTTKKKTVAKKTAKKSARKPAKKSVKKSAKESTEKKKTAGKPAQAKSPLKAVAKGATKNYKLTVGDQVPDFSTQATSGHSVSATDLQGHYSVIYFYPKDNTPGCTLEGQDFRRLHKEFSKADCLVYGVSQDSLKSHENFKAKCDLPFELLVDESGQICKAFDVIQMKNMYGRQFEGIERSTFVIDPDGMIRGEWRKVRVEAHAQEVLDFIKSQSPR